MKKMRRRIEGGKIPLNLSLYLKAISTVFIAENYNFFVLEFVLSVSAVTMFLPVDNFMGSCL